MSAVPRSDAVRYVPLTAARLDALLAIEERAYSHPWSRGNFLDALRAGYLCQLLLKGEELLGYFIAMKGVDEVHLLNITVAPEHQRQGWARAMLDSLVAWAREAGAQSLWLEVRQSNARATAIYEAYGFRRIGLRKDYYPAAEGRREHALVMSLRL